MLRELQKTNKFMLIVNSVVTKDSVDEAREVLDWANDLRIFYACVPANKNEGPDPELINDPGYRDFVDTLLKRKRQGYPIIGSHRLLDKFLYARPYTCMTTMKPHVGPDGVLPWPCRASVNVEPEMINVTDFKNVREMYEAASKVVSPTGFHGTARNQCGGQCAWYQNYTTEIYRETLLRPWRFLAESRELTSNL
jgi:MoaA/NifB/PqqE/SkfB family radical SAM enzyme